MHTEHMRRVASPVMHTEITSHIESPSIDRTEFESIPVRRPLPSAQRHTVWRYVPSRRAIPDHDKPNSYWNRFSRCGKSSVTA